MPGRANNMFEAVVAVTLMVGVALALAPRPQAGLSVVRAGFEDELVRRLLEGELARARLAQARGGLAEGQAALEPRRWRSARHLDALALTRRVETRPAEQGLGPGLEVVVEARWRSLVGVDGGAARAARLATRLPLQPESEAESGSEREEPR